MSGMMTVERAKEEVERIRAMANDDESAHATEDWLRGEVLKTIASGVGEETAHELARIALLTEDIEFARWCA